MITSEAVRRANRSDASAIARVWLRSRLASVPAIPAPVHSEAAILAWVAAMIESDGEVWLATDATDMVVAMLVIREDWVDQLYVDPSSTGRGIGSRLLKLAKDRRPEGLHLCTFQANTEARRFYEAHDFIASTMTDGDNEEGAPDVRYDWTGPPATTGR